MYMTEKLRPVNIWAGCALVLLVLLTSSCEIGKLPEGTDPETPSLTVLPPTQITETGCQVNWSLNTAYGFQSISVELSEDEDMAQISKFLTTQDIATESLQVSGLKGATPYFYRISMLNDGIKVFSSGIREVETSFRMDNIELTTEDSYVLSGKFAYLETVPDPGPGIIMMHEFGVWANPWIGSDLMRRLVADGYACLTFYFRGHGTSTPMDDLTDLINDKSLLTRDLQAAIDFMNGNEQVSSGQLGLIGASMGATMALAGNGYEEVLSSVALSPGSDGVYLVFPGMTLTSVYYLVGELDIIDDPPLDFPAEAMSLYELTDEPRKLDLIPGTADHGTSLLSRDSLNASIESWFLSQLRLQ
jgi:pimeloyl-ACP methyl ester carboxylesterase